MILAGDIGGTNTRIALFQADDSNSKLKMLAERIYPSREHSGLDEIVSLFLNDVKAAVNAASFGIAGPVINGEVSTPNLPWVINAKRIATSIRVDPVWLINDLEAHASGVADLADNDLVALNHTGNVAAGNAALIAAGTGLGEAGLYWDGVRRRAFACEGGHTDFAPRNDLEIALLQYLTAKFGRVSYERVVSGPGLKNIYDFLRDSAKEPEPEWLSQELQSATDQSALISQYGMQAKAPICERALDMFVNIYGAEAGNLALKFKAVAGVFLSGGIAAKILPKLQGTAFMNAFVSKGRLRNLVETIPVKVIVNDKVGLIGAARYAVNQAEIPAVG